MPFASSAIEDGATKRSNAIDVNGEIVFGMTVRSPEARSIDSKPPAKVSLAMTRFPAVSMASPSTKPISALRTTSARAVEALRFNARSIASTTMELLPAESGTVAVQVAKLSVLVASTPLTRTEATALSVSLAVPRTISCGDDVLDRAVGKTSAEVGGVTSVDVVTAKLAVTLPIDNVACTSPPGELAAVTRTTTLCAFATVPAVLVNAAPFTEYSPPAMLTFAAVLMPETCTACETTAVPRGAAVTA